MEPPRQARNQKTSRRLLRCSLRAIARCLNRQSDMLPRHPRRPRSPRGASLLISERLAPQLCLRCQPQPRQRLVRPEHYAGCVIQRVSAAVTTCNALSRPCVDPRCKCGTQRLRYIAGSGRARLTVSGGWPRWARLFLPCLTLSCAEFRTRNAPERSTRSLPLSIDCSPRSGSFYLAIMSPYSNVKFANTYSPPS